MTALLEVHDLSKHFGGLAAVNACTFTAAEGQITGLIGPNGAGKSTAIDLVSGFKIPDTGTVLFEGSQVQGKAPHRISRMGMIRTFQTPREWPALTVLENLLLARWDGRRERFWRSVRGPSRAEKAAAADQVVRARNILDEFSLLELRNERAGNLSGGQKRLVEFARIRMAQPRLVILDEPMGGVNPVLGERMATAVLGFVTDGTSVVIVEHNLPFIERVTDNVIVMSEGRVIAEGPFDSLRSNQDVVDAYLGEMPTYDDAVV
ncbi:MAG: ABC transporter ATP-binding protein [Candidatus Dormibacteraeota bacterium]|uniref:ABC transporter ATP-binding protein n=1 Tax=Candidatus Aeolococcus gillhamiae TaxID=3127015 RepID=A0A934JZ75_9BACT|nr:ABC transporter ATP-binding protein [Candidatus Dormibacteraeota bacterium]